MAIKDLRHLLKQAAGEERRTKTRHVGDEGHPATARGHRTEQVVLYGEAENNVRFLVPVGFGECPVQAEAFEGVQPLGRHLEWSEPDPHRLELRHCLVLRRQHGDSMPLVQQGAQQRLAEVPDVPSRVDSHHYVQRLRGV